MMSALVIAAVAAALSAPKPHAVATATASPPVLDGALDDTAWELAAAIERFTQKSPTDGAEPSERTTVRVLYDREYLYIGIDCEQRRSRIVGRLSRRDREVESDRVVVALDSRGTGTGAFEFGVNAAGVLVDSIRFNDTEQSFDWDENWEARTRIGSDRWTAELRIPFRVLRFSGAAEHSFGFQIRRYLSDQQELDEWAYTPRTVAGEVSQYGRLDGIHLANRPGSIEIRPSLVDQVRRIESSAAALQSGVDWQLFPGADLNWHITPDLTLQATVNPDFGQVEADQRVLNLATSETYYPEKRTFFLDGIDVFSMPLQMVYTRRIGRETAAPVLRRDQQGVPVEAGVDLAQPTTIYGATKLTGRIGDKWTLGVIGAVTAPNDIQVQSLGVTPGVANGTRENRRIDDLSLFNALRVKRDVGRNASVGMLATAVVRAESAATIPGSAIDRQQTWCPDGTSIPRGQRCSFNAYVGAVDGRWRSAGGDYSAVGQATASLLDGGYQRSVPDGTSVRSGDSGYGATATVAKDGGRLTGSLWGEYATPRLDYNDLGFMKRANFAGGGLDVNYRIPEQLGPTLESKITFGSYFGYNTYGVPVGSGVGLGYFARFKNFWSATAIVRTDFAWFDDRELDDGRGTALERPGGYGYDVVVNSPPTERISFSLGGRGSRFSEGYQVTGRGSMLVHVVPQWDLEVVPSATVTGGQPRFASSFDAGGNPLFGRLQANGLSTVLRSTYTFTPALTFQTYGQLFLASEHYSHFASAPAARGDHAAIRLSDLRAGAPAPAVNPDTEGGAINLNVVLRWEYRLGSLFYLTYARTQVPDATTLGSSSRAALNYTGLIRAPAVDTFSLKLSFLWR
ncbi:MAG: DUF5916 domain-containing protein [Acidobacteriota bacterium]